MYVRSLLLITLMGIAIGLFIGILDSSLHFLNIESFKIINIIVFLLFFIGIYLSVTFFRERIKNGLLTYAGAFRNTLYIGFIAALVIAAVRFIFLKYIDRTDINSILSQTKESMISQYNLYSDEIINNRLSFIEFTYDPIVSSVLYFAYYLMFIIIFAFFASFLVRRIDRNISL